MRHDLVPCVVQKLNQVKDETEARRRGFPIGDSFKQLEFDFILAPESIALPKNFTLTS